MLRFANISVCEQGVCRRVEAEKEANANREADAKAAAEHAMAASTDAYPAQGDANAMAEADTEAKANEEADAKATAEQLSTAYIDALLETAKAAAEAAAEAEEAKAKEEAEAWTREAKSEADAWEKEEGVELNKKILDSIAQEKKKKRCILWRHDDADPSQAQDRHHPERVLQWQTWCGQHKA